MDTLHDELFNLFRNTNPSNSRLAADSKPTANPLAVPQWKSTSADPDTPYDQSGGYTG